MLKPGPPSSQGSRAAGPGEPASGRRGGGPQPLTPDTLRVLFAGCPDAVLIADDTGRYVGANQAAADLLGCSVEQLLSMRVADLVAAHSPSSAERYEQYMAAGRETGEFPFVRPDGEERVAEYSAWRIAPGVHMSILRDSTTRMRAEESAREEAQASQALLAGQKRILERIARGAGLANVLQSITAMVEREERGALCSVMLLDETGKHLQVGAAPGLPDAYLRVIDGLEVGPNAGACGAAAFRRETVIAADIATDPLWAPYRELALSHALRACWASPTLSRSGEVLGVVAIYRRQQGRPHARQMELLEGATYLAGIAIERHREQARLRHQAATLRQQADLIEAAHDAILVLDTDHRISFWNSGAEGLYGWTSSEAIGQVAPALLHTEFPIPLADVMRYLDDHGHWRGELAHRRRDGAHIRVDSHWVLTRDEQGKPLSVLEINRNITESKRAEEEVAALNVRLQRAMAETHHRVKNNLQIVAAMVDMQLADTRGAVPEEELRRLASHVRALAIVHDLLTHQAREGGEAHSMSSAEVLESLLPLLQSMAGKRRVLGHAEADVPLTTRQGTSLALITNELVNNAVKYGSGVIEVRFQQREGRAALVVSDDGPGFPAGFGGSAASTTGLMLVENLSRWDLGGATRYQNRPEGGAMVTVEFPIVLAGLNPRAGQPSTLVPVPDSPRAR